MEMDYQMTEGTTGVPEAIFADYDADGVVDEKALAAYDESNEAHWR